MILLGGHFNGSSQGAWILLRHQSTDTFQRLNDQE
jgi:hypothetical protein